MDHGQTVDWPEIVFELKRLFSLLEQRRKSVAITCISCPFRFDLAHAISRTIPM
jgi:hypothetical protein